MTELDFVLLTVYFLGVSYVLYQIVDSFNDEFTIRLEQDELDQQLEALNVKDTIGVSFRFDNRYEFNKLKQLAIRIQNKSESYPIYVDWDHCVLTNLDGRSRRVARFSSGGTLDAFQNQVFSIIAPKRTLQELISGEDQLSRTGTEGFLEVSKTVIDLNKPDPKKSTEAQRKRYRDFMASKITLEFELHLAIRLVGANTPPTGDRTRIICKLTMIKLDWTAGLPWNPKKPF
ncbi:hypothetical protein [Myxacorys almedinensis]|uniref:Uncharacterized protein n=1 Tax=Myxacorys almedinensis A TaxID=2690445 RepID=A0A8J7Z0T0_9CYAN|nr:hypothetical protein [Myxacorys almedinensis]NDJ17020.1 hypothetical protein [Myxacorys almedinensis A]